MNKIWFSKLSDPQEFPDIKQYPNFLLPYNFLMKRKGYENIQLEIGSPTNSPFAGLKEMQENINKLYSQIQDNIKNMGVSKMLIPCTNPGMNAIIKLNLDCDHDWKQYQGFTENYDYCSKCDIKK